MIYCQFKHFPSFLHRQFDRLNFIVHSYQFGWRFCPSNIEHYQMLSRNQSMPYLNHQFSSWSSPVMLLTSTVNTTFMLSQVFFVNAHNVVVLFVSLVIPLIILRTSDICFLLRFFPWFNSTLLSSFQKC